ncbi:MAG: type II toxin-antitoxin system VapC family toxin [Candidatus Promineifilaceae bacterium]
MGVTYLADTNIVSEIMRPKPDATVQTAWKKHRHETAICSITWHELLAGVYYLPTSKRRTALENFLHEYVEKLVVILPYDQAAADWHAFERARLRQLGKTPSFADGQIAAVAATSDLVLITRNVNDFLNFSSLSVSNWFESSQI